MRQVRPLPRAVTENIGAVGGQLRRLLDHAGPAWEQRQQNLPGSCLPVAMPVCVAVS